MKTISKMIIGVALSSFLFLATPFASHYVTYPEVITIEDIEEEIPITTETKTVTVEKVKSSPHVIEVETL